jgi:hypothetical protein
MEDEAVPGVREGGRTAFSGYPEGVPRFWGAFWPRWYRALRFADPLLHRWLERGRLGNVVELTVTGRRSGLPRTVLLGLLTVGAEMYLGHPDVACPWTLNLEAAGEGVLHRHGSPGQLVRAERLPPGPERAQVIRRTFRQHPFPGNVLYWLGREHVQRVGVFFRLDLDSPVA